MDYNENRMNVPCSFLNDDMELDSSEASEAQFSDDDEPYKYLKFPDWILQRCLSKSAEPNITNLVLQMHSGSINILFIWGKMSYPMTINYKNLKTRKTQITPFIKREPVFDEFRSKMLSLPNNIKFGKITFDSTVHGELEDTFMESVFMKKWTCHTFEYNITGRFSRAALVCRLMRSFKPIEIFINLQVGSFYVTLPQIQGKKSSENVKMKENDMNMHVHVMVHAHDLPSMEYDASEMMKKIIRDEIKKTRANGDRNDEVGTAYSKELARALKYGRDMMQTLSQFKEMIKMIAQSTLNKILINRFQLKKLVIRATNTDMDCPQYLQLFSDETVPLSTLVEMKESFSDWETMVVCARSVHSRSMPCLSLSLSHLRLPVDNKMLCELTKSITNFQCNLPMTFDREALKILISEWLDGTRELVELRIDINEPNCDFLIPLFKLDNSDHKWFKLRRYNGRRSALFIMRETVNNRVLVMKSCYSS